MHLVTKNEPFKNRSWKFEIQLRWLFCGFLKNKIGAELSSKLWIVWDRWKYLSTSTTPSLWHGKRIMTIEQPKNFLESPRVTSCAGKISPFLSPKSWPILPHEKYQKIMKKSIFFKVIQTFRGWFLSGLERVRRVFSTSKHFYRVTRRFWENSIFCVKTCHFWAWGDSVKNTFFTKKSIFFKVFQTFRGWFLSGLDSLRSIVST